MKLLDRLEALNEIVWKRDGGQCIRCGSGIIVGQKGKSGAHHILSRGAHPELKLCVENMCLLCVQCHRNANTRTMIRELLGIMWERYHYAKYGKPPYDFYLTGGVK